jgi:threonine aldolase
MAAALAASVDGLPGLKITRPVQANAVFAVLPPRATEALLAEFPFYVWDEITGEVRWMCSWDTTEDDVSRFAAAVSKALNSL